MIFSILVIYLVVKIFRNGLRKSRVAYYNALSDYLVAIIKKSRV